MLVVVMNDHLLKPQTICQGCLLANHQGLPRVDQGHLTCGRLLDSGGQQKVAAQYECQMGFRIASVGG